MHPCEVRRRTHAVARRLDDELGPEQPPFIENGTAENGTIDNGTADSGPVESCTAENGPAESRPLIVGLDGGYVHRAHRRSRRGRSFEVIAGKSAAAPGSSKCFGFVQAYDPKPRRRVSEALNSQGMHTGQPVTFLTDGAVDVRHLPRHLNPQAVHILDWFHVTMRFTVMNQMAKSVRIAGQPGQAAAAAEKLERLKWLIWHGNIPRAMQTVGDLKDDLDVGDPGPEHTKLLKEVRKFGDYINDNAGSIPDYGQRHRAGEPISTAFVESTVNQVISKRMVKKQQMRWTPAGAHLLIQVRTRVLNDELADDFHRWYPGFTHTAEHHDIAA